MRSEESQKLVLLNACTLVTKTSTDVNTIVF